MTDISNVVVGLGETGSPLFSILKRGFDDSVGIDPAVGVSLDDCGSIGSARFLHICIPGDLPEFRDILNEYSERFSPQATIIHSTVPVGTTSSLDVGEVFHSPINGKHADMEASLSRHIKFIGGIPGSYSLNDIIEMFDVCGVELCYAGKSEVTELGKTLSTTLYGYLIAWEQEVEHICAEFDLDRDEVRQLWCKIDSTDWDPKVKTPGFIGGHCVMPNIDILLSQLDSEMLDWIKSSNKRYIENAD